MIAVPQFPVLSPSEYLCWEAKQSLKYEYVEGEIYTMTGGTLPHNSITLNLATALKMHLRGQNCKVFMADAKLQIIENVYIYPDVAVTCDPQDCQATDKIHHPKLIIEVLSPGTEAKDRGRKFYHYRRLASLQEYWLVTPHTMQIEVYRLNASQRWELTTYVLDEERSQPEQVMIPIAAVGLDLSLAQVYEDVNL
ncbi:MAG: Uma2 family endonuclease [Spirulina sp. SIO3F2]|nr:Uma2 family endonuclease [Spirulina sp. SIO3F2]